MNASALVNELAHQGIQLWCDGDQLRFRAPKGVITPAIKGQLKTHKPQILDVLREATHHGIPVSELQELAGDDWSELQDDPDALESFAHAVATRKMRASGWRPAHYIQRSECAGCGPVWLWKGAPKHVQGCPWCLNRADGKPIPRVTT